MEACLLSEIYYSWDADHLRPLALETRSGADDWLEALASAIRALPDEVERAKLGGMLSIGRSYLHHLWYRLLPPIDADEEAIQRRDEEFF